MLVWSKRKKRENGMERQINSICIKEAAAVLWSLNMLILRKCCILMLCKTAILVYGYTYDRPYCQSDALQCISSCYLVILYHKIVQFASLLLWYVSINTIVCKSVFIKCSTENTVLVLSISFYNLQFSIPQFLCFLHANNRLLLECFSARIYCRYIPLK